MKVGLLRRFDTPVRCLIMSSAALSVLISAMIMLSVLWESYKFFQIVSPADFIFGLKWSPQLAIRADQAGSSGAFGAAPLFAGTFLITMVALLVAVPLGLFAAIYMSEYAGSRLRAIAKPSLELLAGIPTVVYGYLAIVLFTPFARDFASSIGLEMATESALIAGLVMGVMIIPLVSSLSDDVINAVPQSLRDASLAMGATSAETVKKVVLPAAMPGIVAAVLLAMSRAIGETMIVVMAAGYAANMTLNPLESVTTVTVQIVKLLVGDQEYDNPKTLAAFALGLCLFFATLIINYLAVKMVKKYREKYE